MIKDPLDLNLELTIHNLRRWRHRNPTPIKVGFQE
jgi:hypothetical protein